MLKTWTKPLTAQWLRAQRFWSRCRTNSGATALAGSWIPLGTSGRWPRALRKLPKQREKTVGPAFWQSRRKLRLVGSLENLLTSLVVLKFHIDPSWFLLAGAAHL